MILNTEHDLYFDKKFACEYAQKSERLAEQKQIRNNP